MIEGARGNCRTSSPALLVWRASAALGAEEWPDASGSRCCIRRQLQGPRETRASGIQGRSSRRDQPVRTPAKPAARRRDALGSRRCRAAERNCACSTRPGFRRRRRNGGFFHRQGRARRRPALVREIVTRRRRARARGPPRRGRRSRSRAGCSRSGADQPRSVTLTRADGARRPP